MADILEYVQNYQVSFSKEPINALDSMIFSELTYCHFENTPRITSFKQLAQDQAALDALSKGVWGEEEMKRLLKLLSESSRFSNVTWKKLTNKIDVTNEFEFNAVTFQINSKLHYLAYRGTTATKVGWKEDFNMSFSDSVPAHFFAKKYFREFCKENTGMVCLGGHSKGGNLAFYVGLTASEEEERIIKRIDNFDGPGFHNQVTRFDERIKQLKGKIHKFISQASMIGILLDDIIDDKEYCEFVKSKGIPPMQHNLFNWQVQDDHFVLVKQLDKSAQFSLKTLSEFLNNTSDAERKKFINFLYNAANVNDKLYLREMFTPKGTGKIITNLLRESAKNQATWKPILGKMWSASTAPGLNALADKKSFLKNQSKFLKDN